MGGKTKKELPEMIDLFKNIFPNDSSSMNLLVEYEVLVLEIQNAINESSDNALLGFNIKKIMTDWRLKYNK